MSFSMGDLRKGGEEGEAGMGLEGGVDSVGSGVAWSGSGESAGGASLISDSAERKYQQNLILQLHFIQR